MRIHLVLSQIRTHCTVNLLSFHSKKKIYLIFTECLLYAIHFAKLFVCICYNCIKLLYDYCCPHFEDEIIRDLEIAMKLPMVT